jgi:hypothetical protein
MWRRRSAWSRRRWASAHLRKGDLKGLPNALVMLVFAAAALSLGAASL